MATYRRSSYTQEREKEKTQPPFQTRWTYISKNTHAYTHIKAAEVFISLNRPSPRQNFNKLSLFCHLDMNEKLQ